MSKKKFDTSEYVDLSFSSTILITKEKLNNLKQLVEDQALQISLLEEEVRILKEELSMAPDWSQVTED